MIESIWTPTEEECIKVLDKYKEEGLDFDKSYVKDAINMFDTDCYVIRIDDYIFLGYEEYL